VTCLDYLAQYAKYKVWVKPSSELSYLYGNNVLKAGLGRITENTPQYQVTHELIVCLTLEPPALPTG
jgi:60S ribosome subunit biogenesis protein NIP7